MYQISIDDVAMVTTCMGTWEGSWDGWQTGGWRPDELLIARERVTPIRHNIELLTLPSS